MTSEVALAACSLQQPGAIFFNTPRILAEYAHSSNATRGLQMQYQLAEINIATFRVPMSDPVNAGFIAQLDRVNALAECAPGFVWRLVGEGNNAMDIRAFDNPNIALNMSVWKDVDALASFVYRSEGHREIMRRRREWFDRMEFHLALWWVEAGHHPTIAEGKARLEMLSRVGPSAHAFLFNKPFPPPNGVLSRRAVIVEP